MSNLTLPTMTTEGIAAKLGRRTTGKLAYETYARREVIGACVGDIVVEHHGNAIAYFTDNGTEQRLFIRNAGWASATTRDRLNAILTDNGTGCGMQVRKGYHRLILGLAGERRYLDGFSNALFVRLPHSKWWSLTEFNGEPVTADFLALNATAR